jgi:hypothetical protein
MKKSLINFSGLRPKLATHLLDDAEAQIAMNCRIEKADVRAWKRAETQQTITTAVYKSLYQYKEGANSNWCYSTSDLDFAETPIAGDSFERLYFTGETEPRAYANDLDSSPWDQSVDFYKFGPAVPAAAAAFVSGHTGGSSYRAYVYTYVTRYGEETGPSAVLETSVYNTGNVVLGTFTQPPSGYALRTKVGSNAPKIRVYRTNSSVDGAEFQYVNEFDIDTFNFSTGTFTDNVADASLGEVLPTTLFEGIPSGLTGLIGLSNGIFAGFVGNQLYLSEPYQPHAWPSSYVMSFDFNIVGLGHYGTNLVVLTEGIPYMVYGTAPETMAKQRLQGFHPCVSKRSIVNTPRGVLFASNEGLILINHERPINITAELLTPEDWADFYPNYMHGEYYNGKYFGHYNEEAGFILDLENAILAQLSEYACAQYMEVAGGNYYTIRTDNQTNATTIEKWEGDSYNYLYFTWKSKKFVLPQDMGFTCAQILNDNDEYQNILDDIEDNNYLATLNATVWSSGDLQDVWNWGTAPASADMTFNYTEWNASGLIDFTQIDISGEIRFRYWIDGELILEKNVTDDKFFRLPPHRGRRMEFQLEGYIPIRKITIAQSPREIE